MIHPAEPSSTLSPFICYMPRLLTIKFSFLGLLICRIVFVWVLMQVYPTFDFPLLFNKQCALLKTFPFGQSMCINAVVHSSILFKVSVYSLHYCTENCFHLRSFYRWTINVYNKFPFVFVGLRSYSTCLLKYWSVYRSTKALVFWTVNMYS